MYDFFNLISIIALLTYNVLLYKKKTASLGRLSSNIVNSYSKRHKNTNIKTFLAIIELLLVSFFQYALGGAFNRIFGDLVGTGANYFSLILFSPIFVSVLCFFIGTNIFKQLDLITPAYPFTLIFVRLACFCAGCCNGMPSSTGLYNHSTNETEIPIQLIEIFLAVVLFVFLMLRRNKAKEGTMFPTYMITYSIGKFFIEFLSAEKKVFLVFNAYHILSIVFILIAIGYLYVIKRYKSRIELFANDFFDSAEVLYDEVMDKINPKRKRQTIHHSKQKKKKNIQSKPIRDNKKINDMKKWILVWSIGLMGQIGWNIESTWFSTFFYEKIDKSPTFLTPMLYLGAFATTLSVFIFGTISDRTGKRRTMISSGFIIWGLLSIVFSSTQILSKIDVTLAAVCVVIIDLLMSFFIGMSVSVGFNAWITDILNENNSAKIGAALAVQTVLGSLLANVIGGALIGRNNNYTRLFVISGIILVCIGWLSTYLFDPKDDVRPSVRGSFREQFLELFDYKIIFKHKELVWVNITVTLFFMGFSSYFPHLGNFLTQYLGYSADKMGIIEAIPMVLAMFITLPVTKLINKNKFILTTIISIVLGLLGGSSIFMISPDSVDVSKYFNLKLFLGIFLVASSYIIMLQATKTWSKNLYPKDSKGQYEGLWAISYALIPMFFGSNIGQLIIRTMGANQFNEYTQRYEYIPNQNIFIIGTLISVLSIIPIMISKRYLNKKNEQKKREEIKI